MGARPTPASPAGAPVANQAHLSAVRAVIRQKSGGQVSRKLPPGCTTARLDTPGICTEAAASRDAALVRVTCAVSAPPLPTQERCSRQSAAAQGGPWKGLSAELECSWSWALQSTRRRKQAHSHLATG